VTPRWRAASPEDLVWVDWGAQCALYHRPSGKTHFINETTAKLLRDVLNEPASVGDVCSALGLPAGPDDEDGSVTEIGALIERLEALGLLQRVGP
jgi:PqqD family protein of HPr-rel-A system